MNVLITSSLYLRGSHAAAAPGPPNGPAALLNPDVINRELQKLQDGSNKPHLSRYVKQLLLSYKWILKLCVCSSSVINRASFDFPCFVSRQCVPIARGRTHQVEEYLQRKREAILNKVRAEGQLVCNVTAS